MPETDSNPQKKRPVFKAVAVIAIIIIAFLLYHHFHKPVAAAVNPNQAVPVTVETLKEQNIRTSNEFSGRLKPVDSAEIRPEVSGRIVQVNFRDGQEVSKGDTLFLIEPRPYEAAVAKAQANVATAETNAQFAKTEMERANIMIKTQAISQQLYDQRANASRVADANIKSARAELENAEVDLERAHVKAPISGRTGRVELTVGNIVQAGANAPLLTTIVSDDEIYADFEVDEATYMNTIRSDAGDLKEEQQIPVELTVTGDKEHVYTGNIYTFDNHIDPASGTIRARAKFPNKDNSLVPGMFVTVKLSSSKAANVVMVPESAIQTDQDKKFVYVVGDGNKVVYRVVVPGAAVDGQRVILSGLKAGEKIVVDGTQHVRPDAVVAPTEIAAVDSGQATGVAASVPAVPAAVTPAQEASPSGAGNKTDSPPTPLSPPQSGEKDGGGELTPAKTPQAIDPDKLSPPATPAKDAE